MRAACTLAAAAAPSSTLSLGGGAEEEAAVHEVDGGGGCGGTYPCPAPCSLYPRRHLSPSPRHPNVSGKGPQGCEDRSKVGAALWWKGGGGEGRGEGGKGSVDQ